MAAEVDGVAGHNSSRFGDLLRSLRTAHGWSLRDLANRIRFNRGYIGKVEQGEKFPERQFAELADRTLGAAGSLLATWQAIADDRQEALRTGRLLVASTRDSLRMIASADEGMELADLHHATQQLAVSYLSESPGPMLQDAVALRSEALRRLRSHQYRPREVADLYVITGRLQGILAYAALDLGDSSAAMTHADAALVCADRAGDRELRSWVRGTQSLISRFDGDYTRALSYIADGLRDEGKGKLRLLCGYAQCHANLGDSRGSNRALDQAQRVREKSPSLDLSQGVFGFSEAKQHYYAGSSLIWLDSRADADRAVREATEAIELWKKEPAAARSLDDEALAHIYQGTAHLQLGQLDAAAAAVRPVLDLPRERHISWIRKRLNRFADMLLQKPYVRSREAVMLNAEVRAVSLR
ncbi:helix-turn-helix domain-containing protein [Solwaraspora sp. WMMB335]|uniref:helix-turn-helix domain-containing protein n=1 Tax=Solwaraspora sp. WMMB335 TaxID=3404118 RepID=UPI003B9288B8